MRQFLGIVLVAFGAVAVGLNVLSLPSQPANGRIAYFLGGLTCGACCSGPGVFLLVYPPRRPPRRPEDEEPHDPFAP